MKRGEWRVDEEGQTLIYTRAVAANRQAAVLEIRFNRATKIGRYTLRLARSGYEILRDGGLEWDALARVLRKYAWMVGTRSSAPCPACGGALWRMPARNRRRGEDGWVSFSVYVCVTCGRAWEGEFSRE